MDCWGRASSRQSHEGGLVLVAGNFSADAINPVIGVALREHLETVVLGRGEDAEDMLAIGAGRFDWGNGCHFGEADGDADAGGLLILVDGEKIGPQDEVGGFPGGTEDMLVLDAPADPSGLQDAVEFEAAVLVDGGEGIQVDVTVAGRRRAEMDGVVGDLDGGGSALSLRRGTSQYLIHSGCEDMYGGEENEV
jgi:hypothetical protein